MYGREFKAEIYYRQGSSSIITQTRYHILLITIPSITGDDNLSDLQTKLRNEIARHRKSSIGVLSDSYLTKLSNLHRQLSQKSEILLRTPNGRRESRWRRTRSQLVHNLKTLIQMLASNNLEETLPREPLKFETGRRRQETTGM